MIHMQATFHVFGMELLATLDLQTINSFFGAFFRLPAFYWRGFLASQLTAAQLISFALIMFVIAGVDIKTRLVMHLLSGEDRVGGVSQLLWGQTHLSQSTFVFFTQWCSAIRHRLAVIALLS